MFNFILEMERILERGGKDGAEDNTGTASSASTAMILLSCLGQIGFCLLIASLLEAGSQCLLSLAGDERSMAIAWPS